MKNLPISVQRRKPVWIRACKGTLGIGTKAFKVAPWSKFSPSVLLLDKFVQQELKQRHSDSLSETKVFHQARHRNSGCYS